MMLYPTKLVLFDLRNRHQYRTFGLQDNGHNPDMVSAQSRVQVS